MTLSLNNRLNMDSRLAIYERKENDADTYWRHINLLYNIDRKIDAGQQLTKEETTQGDEVIRYLGQKLERNKFFSAQDLSYVSCIYSLLREYIHEKITKEVTADYAERGLWLAENIEDEALRRIYVPIFKKYVAE